MKNKHQVSVAGESFAAGIFAHSGFSVFVQYGANQPGYDLVVSDDAKAVHVSVKASRTGEWSLAKKEPDGTYAQALSKWRKDNRNNILCFVQFDGVAPGQMPRVYLASGSEVARYLKKAYYGRLSLFIAERRVGKRGDYKGKHMAIPAHWLASAARAREVFTAAC